MSPDPLIKLDYVHLFLIIIINSFILIAFITNTFVNNLISVNYLWLQRLIIALKCTHTYRYTHKLCVSHKKKWQDMYIKNKTGKKYNSWRNEWLAFYVYILIFAHDVQVFIYVNIYICVITWLPVQNFD